jgi:3-hydroxyisobutyrate dehydrogenase
MSDEDRAPIEAAGGRYIDIAVMGGFFKSGIKAPMLVAGEDVEPVVAWMNASGFEAKVLGPRPGSASSVKMIRSVLIKGVEALGVEAYVTAERQGILKEVMGCMGDVDQISFANFVAMLVQTHSVHAHRRWEEMGLVAQTLRETGVEPLMTEVIERSHRRTVDAQIAPADGKVPSLEEALKILSEKVVRGR